jgi:hypothetical protein
LNRYYTLELGVASHVMPKSADTSSPSTPNNQLNSHVCLNLRSRLFHPRPSAGLSTRAPSRKVIGWAFSVAISAPHAESLPTWGVALVWSVKAVGGQMSKRPRLVYHHRIAASFSLPPTFSLNNILTNSAFCS